MKVFLKRHLNVFPKLHRRLSSVKWALLLAVTAMFFMSAAAPNGCNFMVSFGGGGATVTGPNPQASQPATGGGAPPPSGSVTAGGGAPPAGSPPAGGGAPPAGSPAAGGGAPPAGSPAAGGGAPPAGSPAAGGGAPPAGSPAAGGGAPPAGSPAAGGGAPPAGSPAAGGGAPPAGSPAAGGGSPAAGGGAVHIVMIAQGPSTPTDTSGFIFVDSVSKTTVTTIKKGTTVMWTNPTKAPHTVTADPGQSLSFDSGIFAAGKTYSMTFNQVGKFTYSCTVHPGQIGEIDVTA